jgi:crotonobetainyl-CoA:carnitine CoA-transferase CaiB-like acyl-CoA transferase
MGGFTKAEPLKELLVEIGRPELFGTRVTRENRAVWAEVFERHTAEEWTDLLWPVEALCMPVLEVGEVLGTEQAGANGYVVQVDDPVFGPTIQAADPFQLDPPAVVRSPAPAGPRPVSLERKRHDRRSQTLGSATGGELPLSGTRVVDFGAFVAGPFATQCLADFGADVIKVEPLGGERGREINQFTGCQRGKRSIAVDLRHPRAAEVLGPLLASADVVTHNMRLAAASKMGIDEAGVRRANPNAVFVHTSGYGTSGPLSRLPAFDPTGFALSGWGHGISGPGNRPSWLRMSAMDCVTGLAGFVASTLSLLHRERTGVATTAATSLLAVAVTFSSETLLTGSDNAPAPYRPVDENQTGFSPWARIYRAIDGWIAVSATTDAHRLGMIRVLGTDPTTFESSIAWRASGELLRSLEQEGVPCERVALDNRDPFFDVELARDSGLVRRSYGTPYGWFENPGGFWTGPDGVLRNDAPIPAVGEHTVGILRELGLATELIEELLAERVVEQSPGARVDLDV